MLAWAESPEHIEVRCDHGAQMAERTPAYRQMAKRIPSLLFEGKIAPIETWSRSAGDDETRGQKGDILEDTGGSPGRVTGRADRA